MSTSAARNENRLTDDDRARIDATLTVYIRPLIHNGYKPAIGSDSLAMQRLAAHSIGCSLDDLRDSEVDEITVTVYAFIEAAAVGAVHIRWTQAQLDALDERGTR